MLQSRARNIHSIMLMKYLCALAHILCCNLLGWRIYGVRPEEKKVMILGAPHTSNLDFFLTLALIHHFSLPLRYLVKNNVFKGPLAWLLKSLGAIPVDRSKSNNLVDGIVAAVETQDEIAVGVLPEGTRKYVDYWKSGFYWIAQGADLPIYPVRINGAKKELHMGPGLLVSGDVEGDVALLAEFYGDAKGVNPANSGPVRVRPRKPAPEVCSKSNSPA